MLLCTALSVVRRLCKMQEVPRGCPDCQTGKTSVLTGALDSRHVVRSKEMPCPETQEASRGHPDYLTSKTFVLQLAAEGCRHESRIAVHSQEVPRGHPDCLTGKTFVLSGVLDSLQREEAEDVVKRHGGRVTGSVSGKTSFLVVGTSCGKSELTAMSLCASRHLRHPSSRPVCTCWLHRDADGRHICRASKRLHVRGPTLHWTCIRRICVARL